MVTSVSVCGDSFGCGSGLSEEICYEKSFGGLVAEELKVPLKVYARSGCCNFVISLQVKKIIEQNRNSKDKPLVLITTTHHSRFIIPIGSGTQYQKYDLSDVEYMRYPPYTSVNNPYPRPLEFSISKKPKLISDTISNFIWYTEKGADNLGYLFKDLKPKLDSAKKYLAEIYDDSIKQEYDTALILKMHLDLTHAGIPHIIMAPNAHDFQVMNSKNFFENNWGYYSQRYPDKMGSGHCNETGHHLVANKLIEKIRNEVLVH
jgi:hypothetical protein